jgi:AraC family transcriptional regulator
VTASAQGLSRTVHDSDDVAMGTFRCPREVPVFEDTGPIERFVVVFPRTSVWIQHRDGKPFVADPLLVTIYNRGQRYNRYPISAEGDRSEWWALAPALAREVAAAVDPRSAEDPDRPYRWQVGSADSALYADQRRLFRRIRAGLAEPLEIDEEILSLVRRVLESAARSDGARPPRQRSTSRRTELAEAARERLSLRLAEPLRLAEIASALGVSPFHLAHAFRSYTGGSLHAARLEIRLRVALECVAQPGADLAAVALALGFSSHSHFTAAFRRRFGSPPSAWRQLGARERQETPVPRRRR